MVKAPRQHGSVDHEKGLSGFYPLAPKGSRAIEGKIGKKRVRWFHSDHACHRSFPLRVYGPPALIDWIGLHFVSIPLEIPFRA
jgi:hypothetical protein